MPEGDDSARKRACQRSAARSNFAGSASAYRHKLERLDERQVPGPPRAASSAWNTQRPSIARLNRVLGDPCAVTALPVGPDSMA